MLYKADFHIHSCLSPCGSLEMSPSAIVEKAKESGLQLICLTDHNSALNCPAFAEACSKNGIIPYFGIEITSTEEVHCLAVFDNINGALELGEHIYSHLPNIYNEPERFGDQVYVDVDENIIGEVDKLLINGVDLSIEELKDSVRTIGGLFIPAHIERPVNSMISQLGFLPVDDYDAVEISKHFYSNLFPGKNYSIKNLDRYTRITNSDSHHLDSIGTAYNILDMEDTSISSFKDTLIKMKIRMCINNILH